MDDQDEKHRLYAIICSIGYITEAFRDSNSIDYSTATIKQYLRCIRLLISDCELCEDSKASE